MYLCDGKIGNEYKVEDIDLPVNIEKRLEALGMTRGTSIAVLNSKSRGVLIVKVRGTRFALGRNNHKEYFSGVNSDERKFDYRLHRKSELRKDNTFQCLHRCKSESGKLARCNR